MNFKTFIFLATVSIVSCNSPQEVKSIPSFTTTQKTWTPPPSGTIVDEYTEQIREDDLNDLSFKVTIISTDESEKGIYDLHLAFGYNENETQLVLPKWPDYTILKPVIKKGQDKYQCLIGFETGDDTFHELYEVKVDNQDITMKQTKAYYLEQVDN